MVDLLRPNKQIPTDRILQLKRQGLDNDQIIQTLQREGYKSSQIFDALQQAELKESIGGETSLPQDFSTQNPINPSFGMESDLPPLPDNHSSQFSQSEVQNYQSKSTGNDRIEEVVEAMIDEKWEVLVESVNKIVEWKERVDAQLAYLSDGMKNIVDGSSKVKEEIASKVHEYEEQIIDLKTDVEALNKVLKKVLPEVLSKVHESRDSDSGEREEISSRSRKGSTSKKRDLDSDDDSESEDDSDGPKDSPKYKHGNDIFEGTSIDDIA